MSATALTVIDMLNSYDHEDAELLLPLVRTVLPRVISLIDRARRSDTEVIYVNDNFGLWRSHHDELLDAVLSGPHGTRWNRSGLNESVEERADRLWNELLQEIRVTRNGLQILFGFLLTVAFTPRFAAGNGGLGAASHPARSDAQQRRPLARSRAFRRSWPICPVGGVRSSRGDQTSSVTRPLRWIRR
ncbi:DUF6328 family protein [Streptomyces platensis]|uniref:DUF6328 family protein n=1 Tax=Streptomyces platensis TaxID=58346 RepID=UPI0030DE0460